MSIYKSSILKHTFSRAYKQSMNLMHDGEHIRMACKLLESLKADSDNPFDPKKK